MKGYLRDRCLLLVLDNFEQVVSATPFVSELLAGSPRLRVVVTSRAVLHLSGEQTFEVPPLSLPDPEHLPTLGELARYEAVALFVERARSAKHGFELTAENAPAVVEICHRLDGLPLALELASARIRLLTPEAILERLEQRLPLLVGGATDLPGRQQTLRRAIDWSYDLLGSAERRFFERLAVFAGGWTIEAADGVCNPEAELGFDTLDGIAALADQSLVQTIPSDDGEPRFGMLQVIREFAAEKLHGGPDADDQPRRHAAHVLALAETAGPELRSANLQSWQHRLRRDLPELPAPARATDGH
jgi:predicted ATPase